MDVTPFMPVIVEATKFVFDEVGKWIDDIRQRSKKTEVQTTEDTPYSQSPALTQRDFVALSANPSALASIINTQVARTEAYQIEGLVKQIQIHHRNIVDLETTEAEFGPLTPQYIKRSIEREADALIEKSARLKSLLEQVYERRISNG